MSRFELSVRNGLMQADIAKKNLEGIENIFGELNQEIEKASSGEVSFVRAGPDLFQELLQSDDKSNPGSQRGQLLLRNLQGKTSQIAKWEQAADGYPFTINYAGQRHDCWDEISLVNILSEIISAGSFWLTVRTLRSKSE